MTTRGLDAFKRSLKFSRKYASVSPTSSPWSEYACVVTAFKQSFADLPHSWEWANCIRPLSDNASWVASFLDLSTFEMVSFSSAMRWGVFANLTSPEPQDVKSISTPSALNFSANGKSFSPADTAQPRSLKNWFTMIDKDSLSEERANVMKSKKFVQGIANALHPSHQMECATLKKTINRL